jgi:hypothetical protein
MCSIVLPYQYWSYWLILLRSFIVPSKRAALGFIFTYEGNNQYEERSLRGAVNKFPEWRYSTLMVGHTATLT